MPWCSYWTDSWDVHVFFWCMIHVYPIKFGWIPQLGSCINLSFFPIILPSPFTLAVLRGFIWHQSLRKQWCFQLNANVSMLIMSTLIYGSLQRAVVLQWSSKISMLTFNTCLLAQKGTTETEGKSPTLQLISHKPKYCTDLRFWPIYDDCTKSKDCDCNSWVLVPLTSCLFMTIHPIFAEI